MLQSLQTSHKPLVLLQVPWGMVTGPDGNLYIAMDDEFEVVTENSLRLRTPSPAWMSCPASTRHCKLGSLSRITRLS